MILNPSPNLMCEMERFAEIVIRELDLKRFSYQELKALAEKNGFRLGVVRYTIACLKELNLLRDLRSRKKTYAIKA